MCFSRVLCLHSRARAVLSRCDVYTRLAVSSCTRATTGRLSSSPTAQTLLLWCTLAMHLRYNCGFLAGELSRIQCVCISAPCEIVLRLHCDWPLRANMYVCVFMTLYIYALLCESLAYCIYKILCYTLAQRRNWSPPCAAIFRTILHHVLGKREFFRGAPICYGRLVCPTRPYKYIFE